jgi:hypothetical protein
VDFVFIVEPVGPVAEVRLPKGVSVVTLRIVTEGNMNLAWLDFKPKETGR